MDGVALDRLRALVDDSGCAWHADAMCTKLQLLATRLAAWASSTDLGSFMRAEPGEELLHALFAHPTGPTLYLVSDGVGVTSPPHEHMTWAVIVGLSGFELNTLYSQGVGTAMHLVSELVVGPGDFIVLEPVAIHATSVVGTQPTLHLHMYGRPLHTLPPFAARVHGLGP